MVSLKTDASSTIDILFSQISIPALAKAKNTISSNFERKLTAEECMSEGYIWATGRTLGTSELELVSHYWVYPR